jgi:hypothetical protein
MPKVSNFTRTAVANHALFEKAAAVDDASAQASPSASTMDGSLEAVAVARFQAVLMPENEPPRIEVEPNHHRALGRDFAELSSTKPWVANTTAELVAITPPNWDQKQVVHVQHVLRR